MSQESLDDTIKFRAGPLKQAAGELDAVHLGGINISELAREGLTEMLRRTITDEDMITIYRSSRRMPRGLTPGLNPTTRDPNN
jgi:tRNA U55 pseudouridine synthase TruB